MLARLVALRQKEHHGGLIVPHSLLKRHAHGLLAVADDAAGDARGRVRRELGADVLDALVGRILLGVDDEIGVGTRDARQRLTALLRLVAGRAEEGDDAAVGVLGPHGFEERVERELVVRVVHDGEHVPVS